VLEATGQTLLDEARRGYERVLRQTYVVAGPAVPPPAELDSPRPLDAGRALVASRLAGWQKTRARLAAMAGVRGSTWGPISAVLELGELERQARAALGAAVDAFDHLEDTYLAARTHALAHSIGELVASLFGCCAKREGDRWFDVCRLSLMHLRVGASLGFVARRHCSVCDNDFADCQHQPGNTYSMVAARRPDGSCTICDGADCVAHLPGVAFPVVAHAVVRDGRVDEMSFVARPRDPLARLTDVEIPPWEVAASPGNDAAGTTLCCERCTSPCTGFTSVEEALGLV